FDEPSSQDRAYFLGIFVSRKRIEVFLNAQHCKGPGARTCKREHLWNCDLEKTPGRTSERLIFRASQNHTESPERTPMTILRSLNFAPCTRITQGVSESPACRIKSMPQESQIAHSKVVYYPRLGLLKLLEEDGQNQSTCVVVCGVPLSVVGNGKGCVLQHASIVSQPSHVIQFERW